MNEPPGARARVALTGLTVAEYFRDEEGQDVLFFVDNIFRFTQAGSEVSALLGRMPSAVGYQPTLATEMGDLQERITSTKKGSITSVQAIYVPADDLTDPAPATAFSHLDATTVLSRASPRRASTPRWTRSTPPRASSTRRSSARSTTTWRATVQMDAAALQRICRTSSPFSAWTNLSEDDKMTVARARKIERFLSQPLTEAIGRHRPRRSRPEIRDLREDVGAAGEIAMRNATARQVVMAVAEGDLQSVTPRPMAAATKAKLFRYQVFSATNFQSLASNTFTVHASVHP